MERAGPHGPMTLSRVSTRVRPAAEGALRRVSGAGWTIVQTPVAAGAAWYISHTVLGHHQPFFAPIAAAVSLSASKVLRGHRALQMIIGVALGIGIGEAVKAVAGAGTASNAPGAAAIALGAMLALVVALAVGGGFIGQGLMFVNQTAVSAILMIALVGVATGVERLYDALIGGGTTIVITVLLFPAPPMRIIDDATRDLFSALADTIARLADLAEQAQVADAAWCLASGERIHERLAGLHQAQSTARQTARLAPRRWPDRVLVARAQEQTGPVNLLTGTVLSLMRALTALLEEGHAVPRSIVDGLRELTAAFAAMGELCPARAAVHAARVADLLTGIADNGSTRAGNHDIRAEGTQTLLVSRLAQECADDVLRLAGQPHAER